MMVEPLVLLVEDNKSDVFLVEESLRLHELSAGLMVLEDGEKAIQWIEANDRAESPVSPSVILLDLNLPKRHGAEVLDSIRSSERLRSTPVVLFTSSNASRDRALEQRYPATRYFRKSSDIDELMGIGRLLRQVIAGAGGAPAH